MGVLRHRFLGVLRISRIWRILFPAPIRHLLLGRSRLELRRLTLATVASHCSIVPPGIRLLVRSIFGVHLEQQPPYQRSKEATCANGTWTKVVFPGLLLSVRRPHRPALSPVCQGLRYEWGAAC